MKAWITVPSPPDLTFADDVKLTLPEDLVVTFDGAPAGVILDHRVTDGRLELLVELLLPGLELTGRAGQWSTTVDLSTPEP